MNDNNKVNRKIVVLSGKGGVGKSTVSLNLALSLQKKGYKVGLLDIDIHGPSIPTMLNIEKEKIVSNGQYMQPVLCNGIKLVSIGFFLETTDTPLIWRGPRKYNTIKQFMEEVDWGEIDYLIIDSPPGTGDEPLTVCQMLAPSDGAVIVTTPQKAAQVDVEKSVQFLKQLNINILGLIENMAGFICPHCKGKSDIFSSGAGTDIASKYGLKFLGSLPIMAELVLNADEGEHFINDSENNSLKKTFQNIVGNLIKK